MRCALRGIKVSAKKILANTEIIFARAMRIFDGTAIEDLDDKENYDEERIKAVGLVEQAEVGVICPDRPQGERRIISARRATAEERDRF
jgi:uncharacterized DUF497 family protein